MRGQAVSGAGAAGEHAGERELRLASGPDLSERVSARRGWAQDAGTGCWRGSGLGRAGWAAREGRSGLGRTGWAAGLGLVSSPFSGFFLPSFLFQISHKLF